LWALDATLDFSEPADAECGRQRSAGAEWSDAGDCGTSPRQYLADKTEERGKRRGRGVAQEDGQRADRAGFEPDVNAAQRLGADDGSTDVLLSRVDVLEPVQILGQDASLIEPTPKSDTASVTTGCTEKTLRLLDVRSPGGLGRAARRHSCVRCGRTKRGRAARHGGSRSAATADLNFGNTKTTVTYSPSESTSIYARPRIVQVCVPLSTPVRGKNRGKGDLLPRKKMRFGAFYHGSHAAHVCIRSAAAGSA
jgi:hypothetical protein